MNRDDLADTRWRVGDRDVFQGAEPWTDAIAIAVDNGDGRVAPVVAWLTRGWADPLALASLLASAPELARENARLRAEVELLKDRVEDEQEAAHWDRIEASERS